MGRIAILMGGGYLGYGYYTQTTDTILALIAWVLVAIGAVIHFFVEQR